MAAKALEMLIVKREESMRPFPQPRLAFTVEEYENRIGAAVIDIVAGRRGELGMSTLECAKFATAADARRYVLKKRIDPVELVVLYDREVASRSHLFLCRMLQVELFPQLYDMGALWGVALNPGKLFRAGQLSCVAHELAVCFGDSFSKNIRQYHGCLPFPASREHKRALRMRVTQKLEEAIAGHRAVGDA